MVKKIADEKILMLLNVKSILKQHIYENTLSVFNTLKEVLSELTATYNYEMNNPDTRIKLEYSDKGTFDAQMKIAGDLLVFSMHTNIFQFDRDHAVWKTSYVSNDHLTAYCGIINIFNFLNDSFKYNRLDDLGYLIARIFINKDMCYFVEGKRQLGFLYNNFGREKINREVITKIVNTAASYSLEFDLLVPPYDTVKIISVEQMIQKIENSKIMTAKRLGFRFNADDVS
jgi:hypothetical protein